MQKHILLIFSLLFIFILQSCEEQIFTPKPRAYPKIDFPEKAYQPFNESACDFKFASSSCGILCSLSRECTIMEPHRARIQHLQGDATLRCPLIVHGADAGRVLLRCRWVHRGGPREHRQEWKVLAPPLESQLQVPCCSESKAAAQQRAPSGWNHWSRQPPTVSSTSRARC